MSKQFKKFLIKIFFLSSIMVLILNVWDNLINATKIEEYNTAHNTSTFKKANNSFLWKTWVAITTNLWIRYKQRTEAPASIYKDIFSINEIVQNQWSANDEIIWNNMIIIEEYRNVLKTDVKHLINSSYDKSRILNAFIEQLEFRYVLWAKNIKKLQEQKNIFLSDMTRIDAKIEILKQKIESDFKKNQQKESLENINNYLELKKQYYYSRTYIVYINHFLNEYIYLSNYNKKLLDTLINNKEALIKNAYIVLPDTWTELLKKFNLIYDEQEIKNNP